MRCTRAERRASSLLSSMGNADAALQSYDRALSRTLFEYARAGRLLDALDLARQADQPWRAASLRGAMLHWRPGCGERWRVCKRGGGS